MVAALIFLSLLGYRTLLWERFSTRGDMPEAWTGKALESSESWMNIFQSGKKIGFTHRRLGSLSNGYRIDEETVMNINTMGMSQTIQVRSSSTTNMDFAVNAFDFTVASGSFHFAVKGEIRNFVLYIEGTLGGSDSAETMEFPLENRPYLTSGILQAVVASGIEEGESMILFVFDPSTLGQAAAEITMKGRETIKFNGENVNTRKVSLKFKGSRQYAWIDDNGEVVKEHGILGITLFKTDKKGALDGLPIESSDDLTLLASIPSNRVFDHPERLQRLRVKVHWRGGAGDTPHFPLDQGRQQWHATEGSPEGIATIDKESFDAIHEAQKRFQAASTLDAIDARFKSADPFIQSDHPRIQNVLNRVVTPEDPSLRKLQKLVAWIQKNIRRQPVLSLPNALSTLENRVGDCNEHAALMAAFCRAAGIPAKIEAGLVYLNGRFYYHAWNLVYIGEWITVDALFNQIPADVTHIAFSSGAQQLQLDLMGVIGNVELEIID